MLTSYIVDLGPWSWLVLGLILLILEMFAPGVFLLWIGLAAGVVGILSLFLWGFDFWSWQVQGILFAILAIASTYFGKKVFDARAKASDQPLLNRRGEQLIGRTATLTEPIVNGRGRVKLGDTQWRVKGPDLEPGVTVRVTGVSDSDLELVVEAV